MIRKAFWRWPPLRFLLGVTVYAGLLGGILAAFVLFPTATAYVYLAILVVAVVWFCASILPNN